MNVIDAFDAQEDDESMFIYALDKGGMPTRPHVVITGINEGANIGPLVNISGTVGAARTNDPDTANSQFFICFAHSPFLNGKYTVWGKVTEGLDVLPNIVRGEPPTTPTRISEIRIAVK